MTFFLKYLILNCLVGFPVGGAEAHVFVFSYPHNWGFLDLRRMVSPPPWKTSHILQGGEHPLYNFLTMVFGNNPHAGLWVSGPVCFQHCFLQPEAVNLIVLSEVSQSPLPGSALIGGRGGRWK